MPEQKVFDRYARSLDQLPWFAKRASRAFIWDNSQNGLSGGGVVLIAEKGEGGWVRHADVGFMDARVGEAMRRVLAGED